MLTELAHIFISLPADEIRKYIAIAITITFLGVCSSLYYIHAQTSRTINAVVQARALATKTDSLISAYNAVALEEDNLATLLTKKTDYNSIKSYFERFCQTNKVSPEPGWADSTEVREIAGSSRFEEEQLTAQFKKIALKEAVIFIDAIEKDNLLHLRELDVEKNEGSLSIRMTLAAKRFKRTMEE